MSLQKAMLVLQRTDSKHAGAEDPQGKYGGKKTGLIDVLSYMGALNQVFSSHVLRACSATLTSLIQLYDAGLLTATHPSHVSHASDVQAPVM